MEAQPDSKTRGNRGVVVPLQRAAVPEEVDGEETRRLHNVDEAVRVVERDGDFVQRAREEYRLDFGAIGRARKVACEEIDRIHQRRMRFEAEWLSVG